MSRLARAGALSVMHGKRMGTPDPCFYVDALDSSSYPGSGSVWYDISSYGRSGTISGPTWNSGGWFNFSGNYVDWSPGVSSVPTGTDAVSFMCVFQTTTASSAQEIIGFADVSDSGRVGLYVDASGKIGVGGTGGVVITSAWAGVNTWVVLTAVSHGPNEFDFDLYVNGSLVTSVTALTDKARSVYNDFLQMRAGAVPNHPASAQLNGKLAIAKLWFGSLTAAQVDAEFQSIRSRFGL